MKNLFLVLIGCLILVNCSNDEIDSSREQEQRILDQMFIEILGQSKNDSCSSSEQWSFTAIVTKACGGPSSYIIYSTQIDTEDFLEEVSEYTRAEASFNEKWDIVSDCSTPRIPSGVKCVDGRPELFFNE